MLRFLCYNRKRIKWNARIANISFGVTGLMVGLLIPLEIIVRQIKSIAFIIYEAPMQFHIMRMVVLTPVPF